MAKKWEEVASNPEYQNLSSSEKEDVRKEYFENVVKPNVPSEDLAKAQKDFDQFSNPSAARKAINAIKSGVTLFKDAAYDAIDNRTLSEKGLLTSKESDENAMSRKAPGVPLRVDYFDKLKQQDRIAPKSIDAMAGTKGATARAADTVIAERPFNADVNQGTNDAIYGEPQKQIPFDERKREERRLEAEAKAKLFTESLKQAGETRSADQALQQAVNQKPSHEEVTNVANQIAHKEEMQAMYGDIPKPEGMDVATNAAGRAVKTGSALAQNMIAFGSSVVNADDLALKFLQSAAKTQDEAGQYPAALKDFTEIQSWSDVPTYALEGVIENAPMLVGSIGSGALGAFTAKNLGKNKLAKLTQEAAVKELAKRATIGATVGAGTASIGMESGSIFGDIYRETGEQRTALAAAGGIVAGAFDAIPAVMALKTALGGKVGEEAAKTIIKRYGVDGLKQIGAEGGTEFAQTWVEEIAKARASGNDVLSQQNLINSLDAMFKGGAAGGVTHIAAQGFNDLTAKKVEKFKTLPNENLQRLRATAEKAMPQDVPLIDAEIQRRANTPTLQRAVEAGMREGGIAQPAETLPASDILENENDGISDATSILATETDGLGLDNTEGSRGDIPETTGSGTVSDWIIDSTRPLEQGDGGDLSVRRDDSEGKSDITLNDVTAHAAATSDLNDTPQPTEAQKEAGNYKKGSVKVSGMDISIENPHTSMRKGVDKDGTSWENQQNGHYGYIKGVVARAPDKEHVDVNVKPNTAEDYAGDVFVINQNHPGTGRFDEPKVYIGYGSKDEAEAAYRSNYADGWNGLDSVAQIPMEQFKEMLNDEKAFLKPIVTAKDDSIEQNPVAQYQWMRNKEGGQSFGNQESIYKINKSLFDKHVAGKSEIKSFDEFNAKYPDTYIGIVKRYDGKTVISGINTLDNLTPQQINFDKGWVKKVESFNLKEAIDHGKTSDSDLINTKGKENGLQKQGQKTAQKINKQTPKVNSLLSKIFNLGGITSNDKLDVTGQDKSFAPGGYNKIFKKQSRQSLRGMIENGDLDEFLPHNMRVSSITQDSDAYDSAEAYDYLADKIRAGEKVLPYEAQQEIEQNKFQDDLTAEEHVDLVASTLTEDKINEEFRIAANEEREASILATDFIPDNEDGITESSQREAIGKQTEPQTVTSQEREGVRPIVEAIAKRRAAANQINKAKAFDANLQLAKDFMAGKDVKPVKFTTAATLFNKDSALNESFNKLATMAKAPAKEARAEKANIVESYKQRISEAKTQDALQTIAGEIQRDSALSDTQAQALDDIVFDAQDKFETSEPEAESLIVQTRRKELENAQGILAKEPSSLVKIALVRQAEKKLNESIDANNDLLGDNTAAKQAIADAERAKDAKRNEGISDTEGFTLTGSNSEADQAAAAGAQDLFAQPAKAPTKIETETKNQETDAFDVLFKEIQTKESDDGNVVMFSRSKSTQQIYENRIDDLFADGKADFKGTGVKVLDKSDMLNLLGYGDKPVYLSENKVQQGKYNHGLTAEHWKKIPEWLDDPALVFDSDTVTGRLVFIAPELLNGAPIRIIVDPDATANGLKINLVVNAYDAKGKLPFGRWVKDGLLRFYSKAKSLAILARSGLQLSSMAKARSSNGRIYQDSDLVNYKNEDKTNFSRSDAKLPAMREKIMGGLPLFAQGNKKVGMPIADVEKEVKNFSKGWKRIPQVIVVDSMQDERINEHVRNTNKQMIENGATGLPIGFISQGKVYILAPMVNNESDIATVMMHEIFGHAGLRANFGTKLDDILEQIYITRRKEVLAKAKQYGYDFTKHADRLKAAEEVLAEMAQTNPQLGFVKRAIAAIRAWLRANIPYYKNLEITDEDIIGNILIPARNFILKGKTGGSDLGLKKVTPVFSRTNQIKSATGNNGDFDSNNNDIRFSRQGNITPEWDAPEASKIDSLIYTLQDKHIDLKRVTENIKKVGNHIDDRWNAYLQEELYHGRAARRTQDFIKHELEPLIKDMQERKVTMADFEEYLWMRHAPERNKKMASINEGSPDGLAGVSTKDAKEYLANLTDQQKLDFEALAERIDAINKASEQVLIDYGLESTDTVAKWNSAYEYYVPLMREEMENGSGNGTGQGFSVKGNASKRATGSKRAVVDIIANIAQQRERYIIRGEKNRVSTALIGLAKLNPNEDFWRTDTPPTKKDVSKITGMVEEYTDPNYKNRDNVIVARIPDKLGKIQERSVIFNEFDDRAMRMARSLKNLDQDQLHEVLGTASIITRYFSSINTQYNPIFGVINLLRDTQTAAINLSSTPLKGKQKEVMSHVLPALIGIYSDLRSERESGTMPTNEYAILFEEFQKEGGQTGYRDMYRNAKERSAAIEHALDHEWWTKTKIGKAISANGKFAAAEVWMNDKAVKPIFNWLSDYNEAMENAVRLSAYKVAIDNGLSKQQAASIAKNISVNFNRKGEMGRQIGSLYAFFNASVQGTARIADTLLKNDDGKYSLSKTGKTIVKGGLLLGVMQALLLAAAGYSDDDPPAYSKDRNLIIPLDIFGADNKYATIALPLGFNAIPAFSRHITEWALSGGEDTHDRVIQIIDMILNVTNPIGNAGMSLQTALPTLADPLAAIAENKDFTGRDISRKDFNQLDPTPGFTRSRDKAWDVSIAVARAMNWASGGTDYQPGWASPTADQIEYLAGQVTGGVGREIIKAGTTVDALISGEDLPSYKIPLLGRFYGDAASQSSQGAKFYKNITELNKIENELKGRAKNHEDVNSFKENNPEYRAIVTARISLEQVQNLRKRQRAMVEKGEDKEKIKDIDEKVTMIMTRLNTKVEDYRSQANE